MKSITETDRSIMPMTGKPIQLKLEEPGFNQLDNGIPLYSIHDDSIEFVRIDIVFAAGTSFQSSSLVAESTLQLLSEGTFSMSSKQIADKLDYYGTIIDTGLTKDKASISIYTLTKHLPQVLPVITDLIQNPVFDQNELDIFLSRKMNQFMTNNEKVKFKATNRFNELIFGQDTAYGKTKKLADYQNVDRNDLIRFHQNYYNNQNCYIVVGGNIDNQCTDLINKHFGTISLSELNGHTPNSNIINNNTDFECYTKIEDSLQSAIRIGKQIVPRKHPDYNSLVVLNTVLGGYFGSRLMSNIREDKGFTYGINSFIINYLHGGYLCVATEVNATNTNEAIDEIRKEIYGLMEEKIPIEELNIVKNYIYGVYLRSFDGPVAITDRFRAAKDLNTEFMYYTKSLDNMLAQSPEQLRETARKYFDFDTMIKLVVGSLQDDKFNF